VNADTAPAVAEQQLGSFAKRTLSALVLAPIAIAAIWLGYPFFNLLVIVGGAILSWEWGRLCNSGHFDRSGVTLLVVVLVSALIASYSSSRDGVIAALLGALLVYGIANIDRAVNPGWVASGAIYLGIPSAALLWIRNQTGAFAVLWLFAAVWATDIGAYLVGRLIGGPRLAPRLSPNKTWAGLLGGIAAAVILSLIFAFALGTEPGRLAWLGVVVALFAQSGDLIESAIKRRFNVKDMSGIIPGHGGLFDRVDSLLVVAPIMVLVQLFSGGEALAWL